MLIALTIILICYLFELFLLLRGPVDGPAYSSLTFAVNSLQMKGRVGRPQTNLFSLIQRDLLNHNMYINNIDDLNNLRLLAFDRAKWRRMLV